MYLHELIAEFESGKKKIRRSGWPKGQNLVRIPAWGPIEISEEESKAAGLAAGAHIMAAPIDILVESKSSALYGYRLSSEDLTAQDWEQF